MKAQLALQQALAKQLSLLRKRNPSYSLRAFARRLKLNSGALSAIMNGHRRVSPAMATRLLTAMSLDPINSEYIATLFQIEEATKRKAPELPKTLRLKSDQFKFISDGIHYSLLCLFETDDFESDISWMASRLSESPQLILLALSRLERLGLIDKNRDGNYHMTDVQLSTSDGHSDLAIANYHQERLQEAQKKLETVDINFRDFYSSTYTVSKKQLPKARKAIRDFHKTMQEILESSKKEEIYRFNTQLIPVSNLKNFEENT